MSDRGDNYLDTKGLNKTNSLLPIVILNWNGLNDTVDCLLALDKQVFKSFYIYLLDNGSSGQEPERLRDMFGDRKNISLMFNKENIGFTRGNNYVLDILLACKNAHPYVVLLNNDTVPDPQWLDALLNQAIAEDADVVSSCMVNYYFPDRMDNAGHFMLNTGEIMPLGRGELVVDYDRPIENIGACAGAAMYRLEMFRELGTFDEYFDTGYEDAELGLRAFVAGKKLSYANKALVYHKISRSVNKIKNFDYMVRMQVNVFYAFFKVLPLSVIVWQLPSWIFKYISVIAIDILFLRIKFLKIMVTSFYVFFRRERNNVMSARRKFFSNLVYVRPANEIRKKLKFFLWFDIVRFYKYVLLRKPTS